MSLQTSFYREQAAEQQSAADAATLDNVRERCQRAAAAWSALADRGERNEVARSDAVTMKSASATDEGAPTPRKR